MHICINKKMALQNSFKNSTPETSLCTSRNSLSHSRRKSLHVENSNVPVLLENNDEAERLARRCEISTSLTLTEHVNTSNKRRSFNSFLAQMSVPEMRDCISECIKLNSENKINVKNAFSLQIIDLMTHMIKKQDTNMNNLQVASTSLDVSAKIYGFRVDGVYTQIMKMAGGLDNQKHERSTDDVKEYKNGEQEHELSVLQKRSKKKKKRNKETMFGTIDSLRGTVEIMKPTLWIMGNEDPQSTDALYQVMQSNNANSKFYLELYNGIVVDTIEDNVDKRTEEVSISKIESFSDKEICPPLANFEFHGWTNDSETQEDEDVVHEQNNKNKFQFDLDASLPSENEIGHNDINYLDIHDEDENENGEKCIAVAQPMERIVDLCKVISNPNVYKKSEYSFLQKCNNINWAGPSHWKTSNLSKFPEASRIVGTCQQALGRRRKDIELTYDDCKSQSIDEKFKHSKSLKLNAMKRDWCEEIHTLPQDMHYSIASATKLYYHKLIPVGIQEKDNLNVTHITSIVDNYDYNNENDTSNYCPNVPNEDYETSEENENVCNFKAEENFVGDNLITAAKITNKISIAYSTRAKKIDMRQLKKSIWQSLNLNNDDVGTNVQNSDDQRKQNKIVENKHFSDIYKALPKILTKANIEALSFPISFISLLHLANEKTVKIHTLPDMSDLIVKND